MESNGLSGHLFCIVLLDESGGRQIAQSCLLANAVVENFDVFGNFPPGHYTADALKTKINNICQSVFFIQDLVLVFLLLLI